MLKLNEDCPKIPESPFFYIHVTDSGGKVSIRDVPFQGFSERKSSHRYNTVALGDLDISFGPWVAALAIREHQRNMAEAQAVTEAQIREWEQWESAEREKAKKEPV